MAIDIIQGSGVGFEKRSIWRFKFSMGGHGGCLGLRSGSGLSSASASSDILSQV